MALVGGALLVASGAGLTLWLLPHAGGGLPSVTPPAEVDGSVAKQATAPVDPSSFATNASGPHATPTPVNDSPETEELATEPRDARLPVLSLQELVAVAEGSVVRVETTLEADEVAIGSGFVANDRGDVVTNYHVIDGARSVQVIYADGTSQNATGYLAIAPEHDLAVLRVDAQSSPPPLPLAPARPAKASSVCAMGSPQGLDGTVTNGIVSSIRQISTLDGQLRAFADFMQYDPQGTWIQTTAPISGGNSGGPLLDERGQVVGVNSFHHPDGQNLNFAISAEHIATLLARTSPRPSGWVHLPPSRLRGERQPQGQSQDALAKIAEAVREAMERSRAAAENARERQNENPAIAAASDADKSITSLNLELTVAAARRESLQIERRQLSAMIEAIVAQGRQVENRGAALEDELARYSYGGNNSPAQAMMQDAQIRRVQMELQMMRRQHDSLLSQMRRLESRAAEIDKRIVQAEAEEKRIKQQIAKLRRK